MVDTRQDATNATSNWISYIDTSYRNLQQLTLHLGDGKTDINIARALESLKTVMANLTRINGYSINVYPQFPNLAFNVIDSTNNTGVKQLKLEVGHQGAAEEMFHSLESADSIYGLNSLEINVGNLKDSLAASNGIFNFYNNLNLLTHLGIRLDRSEQRQKLRLIFVEILQNLLTLEHLVLENLVLFDEDSTQDRVLSSKLDTVNRGQLKATYLNFYINSRGVTMTRCNLLFNFILHSRPLLQDFKLLGRIDSRGALDLDYRQHAGLVCIEIDLKGCRYYILYKHFAKQWKNVDERILEEDIGIEVQKKLPYFINLTWMDQNNVKLKLATCKVNV